VAEEILVTAILLFAKAGMIYKKSVFGGKDRQWMKNMNQN
jgi:hypothetical protein